MRATIRYHLRVHTQKYPQQNTNHQNQIIHQEDHSPRSGGIIPGKHGWFSIHKSINMIYHSNKLKNKNHIIISMHVEKTFAKIQHDFMPKNTEQHRHKRCILQHRAIYNKTNASITLNSGKTGNFSTNIWNYTGMSTFTPTIQHSIGYPH